MRLPLDGDTAEFGYRALPSRELAPDAVYERSWALAVLDRALTALRAEHGRAGVFDALKDHVWGDPGGATIAEAGAAAGLGETAARVAVHRLRTRFGEILRAQVADTLADPADVDAELRHLLAILGGMKREVLSFKSSAPGRPSSDAMDATPKDMASRPPWAPFGTSSWTRPVRRTSRTSAWPSGWMKPRRSR